MMGYHGYGFGMMGHGWGLLMMTGVLVLLVLGILALIRYLKKPGIKTGLPALNILNERYAKGDINDEEYQKIKAQINKQ